MPVFNFINNSGLLNLIIAGDFCPIGRAELKLSEGESVLHADLEELWTGADYRIANLECPITSAAKGIPKSGPLIKSNPSIRNGLGKLKFNAVSLANNHIMDYGIEGFEQTCNLLEQEGIYYFGVRKENIEHKSFIAEKENIKVGIISYSIAEFCLAEDFNGNGAEGIELIKILNDLEALREKSDHIIILLHMGLNMLPLPSPKQAELCRYLAKQKKVKAILCQHSHITGSFEWVNGCFISYGQGSFVFDMNKKNSHWNNGYLVSLSFSPTEVQSEIHGIVQFNDAPIVRRMNDTEEAAMNTELNELNKTLSDEKLLKESFKESVKKKRNFYYGTMMLPQGRYFNAFSRRVNLGKFIPNSIKLTLLNLFRNEEHNEALQEILKSENK